MRYPVQTTLCASVLLRHGQPLAFLSGTIQGLLTFRDKCCLRRKDYTSVFFSLLFFSFLFFAIQKRSCSEVASYCAPREAGTQTDRFLHHKVSTDELLGFMPWFLLPSHSKISQTYSESLRHTRAHIQRMYNHFNT